MRHPAPHARSLPAVTVITVLILVAAWLAVGPVSAADCNSNGIDDVEDLKSGTSLDCNANLVPDECDSAGAALSLAAEFLVVEGGAGRMALGDFDGDGDDDIAVASEGIESISIIENLGGGTLGDPVAYPAGSDSIGAMAAHDLDGDGDVDIGAALGGDNPGLGVLLNRGDGTFDEVAAYPVGGTPSFSVHEDLDGDGDVDFAASLFSTGGVTVLWNRGDGTFADRVTVPVFERAGRLVAADLDLDGRSDLALVEGFRRGVVTDGLAVLLQESSGSFAPPARAQLPGSAAALAAADVDADGDLDLVATTREGKLAVFPNTGGGAFGDPAIHDTVGTAYSLAVVDIDGDGDVDILGAAEDVPTALGVTLNRGDGTFDPTVVHDFYASAHGIQLADLTGDGLDDVVLAHLNWPRITVFENLGGGDLGEPAAYVAKTTSPYGSAESIVPRDLDGDGDLDLVASLSNTRGGVAVLRNASGQGTPVECTEFVRGDANADGVVSVSDMVTVRRFLFNGGVEMGCLDAADFTDDESVDVRDSVEYLNRLFLSPDWRDPPTPPFPLPGIDVTPIAPQDPDDPDAPPHRPLTCDRYDPQPPEATDDLLRVGDVEGVPGEEVEIPIYLTIAEPIDSMQFVFAYDPSVLSIESSPESLVFDGSFYERFFNRTFTIVSSDGRSRSTFLYPDDRPWIAALTVHPEAGVVTVVIEGHIFFDGFEVLPGEDVLVARVRATIGDDVQPGSFVSLEPTNGEDGGGTGPYRIRNELTHRGDARFVSFVPRTQIGFVNIVGDQSLFIRGDANRDGVVDISDAQRTLGFLFLGEQRLLCRDAADANDDGRLDISDAVFTLDFLFAGGEAPPAPYPEPGYDGTEDVLWCFNASR